MDDKITELEDQEDEVTEVAKKGKRKIKLMNKYLDELKRAISEDVVEALVQESSINIESCLHVFVNSTIQNLDTIEFQIPKIIAVLNSTV